MPAAPSVPGTIVGRWVRLAHTSNGSINLAGMWVYDGAGAVIPVTPDRVTLGPPYDPPDLFPPGNLVDGDPDSITHTAGAPGAFVEMDLGANRTISAIKIENRRDNGRVIWERILGATLTVLDADRREVARLPIVEIYRDYFITVSPMVADPARSVRFP